MSCRLWYQTITITGILITLHGTLFQLYFLLCGREVPIKNEARVKLTKPRKVPIVVPGVHLIAIAVAVHAFMVIISIRLGGGCLGFLLQGFLSAKSVTRK